MKYGVINENHLFVKCYNRGKKVVTKRVVVFVLEDKHAGLLKKSHPQKQKINRVGISVTKKLGGAVERNRAKRIIRAGLFDLQKTRTLKTGYLIVISARGAIAGKKSDDIRRELSYAFERLDMLLPTEKKNV